VVQDSVACTDACMKRLREKLCVYARVGSIAASFMGLIQRGERGINCKIIDVL